MYNQSLRFIVIKRAFVAFLLVTLWVDIRETSSVNTSRFPDEQESKIIGGVQMTIESLPSAAQFFNFGSMCSGTIINSWSILTAAHCFDHNKDIYGMVIQVGARYTHDYDGQVHGVSQFVIHNNYNKEMPLACDIAILFVDSQITFDNKVKKALLATNGDWMNKNEKNFLVAGWGWTKYGGPISEQGLMKTYLEFVPKDKCERMHKLKFTVDMFCLYGHGLRDTCKGDSGGGVMWNDTVVGIVSHGAGCSKKNRPSIYSNVWYFRKWIKLQIQKFITNFCHNKSIEN